MDWTVLQARLGFHFCGRTGGYRYCYRREVVRSLNNGSMSDVV